MTGTLRYMAPEIALGERYNEKCDVYSFTVLLWEMLTCERPYNHFVCQEKLMQHVFTQGERPALPRHWNKSLKELVQSGWTPNVEERATMRQMCRGLSSLIQDLTHNHDSTTNKSSSSNNNNDKNAAQSSHKVVPAHRHSTVVFPLSHQKQTLLELPNLEDRPLSAIDLARILEEETDSSPVVLQSQN